MTILFQDSKGKMLLLEYRTAKLDKNKILFFENSMGTPEMYFQFKGPDAEKRAYDIFTRILTNGFYDFRAAIEEGYCCQAVVQTERLCDGDWGIAQSPGHTPGPMVKLWARAGISFTVSKEEFAEVRRMIRDGSPDEARGILGDAMLSSYEFCGNNYIPDNDDCIAGADELRDFDF